MTNSLLRRGAKRRLMAAGGVAGLIVRQARERGLRASDRSRPAVLMIFQGASAQASGLQLRQLGQRQHHGR